MALVQTPTTPPSGAAPKSPMLPIGQWVQYNAAFDNPRANPPAGAEQTVGIIRQAFTDKGEPYYQVVWMPGDLHPKVGFYRASQLTSVSQQQAQQIISSIQSGTYTPDTGQQGSQYVEPNLPATALPPALQGLGTFSGSPGTSPPSLQQTG